MRRLAQARNPTTIGSIDSGLARRAPGNDDINHGCPMDAREVIKIGMSAERRLVVPAERTVGHFVPHMPMVYATPMMILEMEMASADAIAAQSAAGLGYRRHRGRHSAPGGDPGRFAGAHHREGDRGGTPADPVRGRGLRPEPPDRRGPSCPRPGRCRELHQALRHELTVLRLILRSGDFAASRKMEIPPVAHPSRRRARRAAAQDEERSTISQVPGSAGSPPPPRASAAAAGRPGPSARRARRPWCRRAR